jgi:hypothetical protein
MFFLRLNFNFALLQEFTVEPMPVLTLTEGLLFRNETESYANHTKHKGHQGHTGNALPGIHPSEALEKWMAPGEMIGKIHRFDLKVGGGYEMSLFYPSSEKGSRGKPRKKKIASLQSL